MITLIKNATIINEGLSFQGSLLINGERIETLLSTDKEDYNSLLLSLEKVADKVINADGMFLIPGVIDDQVHFREPGSEYKATIESESAAAVLGGVTSFMDMPNNTPPTCTLDLLEKKFNIASQHSYANYSFYLGANNNNLEEIKIVDPQRVCGVKVFMGSSTGNMLVDSEEALSAIFREAPCLVATHCEEEEIIRRNIAVAKEKFACSEGGEIPIKEHPVIRSREACITSSRKALALAQELGTRLHILHISTSEEIEMLRNNTNPKITGEVCVHYLVFNDSDYEGLGTKIKCNPAIKEKHDMLSIREGVRDGVIAALATDHAPHLLSEKEQDYLHSPSGLPLVQHSLQIMLMLVEEGVFSIEQVVKMMCHSPADCFGVSERGYLREGYFADIVLLKKEQQRVSKENIAYKCRWSPFEGRTFPHTILHTFVSGVEVVNNGKLTGAKGGKRLFFE